MAVLFQSCFYKNKTATFSQEHQFLIHELRALFVTIE